jgi:EAL domain-containing protein (putative c-di-GMP-specific phosphodiesterase class I)
LSTDSKRRAVVESLVALARALDSAVVAEGVDSHDGLALLEGLGVDLVQANLLCPAIRLEELLAAGHLGDSVCDVKAWPDPQTQNMRSFDQPRTPLKMAAWQSFYT